MARMDTAELIQGAYRSWSPCAGGADAAGDGDGYCMAGYHGPRVSRDLIPPMHAAEFSRGKTD